MSRLQKSATLQWSPDGYTTPTNDFGFDGLTGVYSLDGYTTSATFTSAPFFLGQVDDYTLVVSCPSTGSPVGTVALQACDDVSRNDATTDVNLVNWWPLYFTPQTGGSQVSSQAISGATTVVFEDLKCAYRYVRLVYTATSGSITITAKVQIKGVI